MPKARYWCYFEGVASTALALLSMEDELEDPPERIPQENVGFIIGFNPPRPRIIRKISLNRLGAISDTAESAAFHIQAKQRIKNNGPGLGITIPRWLCFINLWDQIEGDPRKCRKILNAPFAFPCKTITALDKLQWAMKELCVGSAQINWICCAWGMKGCRDNFVLSRAVDSCAALKPFCAVQNISVWGFSASQLGATNKRYALDCAHIGSSKKFFCGAPGWRL